MVITKQQAIDILERFDFFQGQRAGRELWNDKPKDVQDKDIADFSRDVGLLKEYINAADVVPKSEVERLQKDVEGYKHLEVISNTAVDRLRKDLEAEVAREIFEEIEKCQTIMIGVRCEVIPFYMIAELKKKYESGEGG